jgi:putative colanic acid biosynthesis UDP-glucose lipid carrier transferase
LNTTNKRYSGYIRPFSYLFDIAVINIFISVVLPTELNEQKFHFFTTIAWLLISWNIQFYEVYRFTKSIEILGKILKQSVLYLLINFAYLGYFYKFSSPTQMVNYVAISISIISLDKFFIYFFLRKFRAFFGGNFRKVIIVGSGKKVTQLAEFFNKNPDYGYKLEAIFEFKSEKEVDFDDCFSFVNQNNIDEIYCALSSFSNSDINKFVDFTDNNLKVLKFLPNNKDVLSRNLMLDYYGYIPIISLRNTPLDKHANKLLKRIFDIVFSSLIIVLLLSWLIPILALLIKLESKGPVFFKQKRNGLNYAEFSCYKFRSMRVNEIADVEQVSKNDPRITKIGKFIRKTSMDELPQFFNAFLGTMSVVGPRPHMVSHTEKYAKSVDKFMVRHFIKPGITGLAQTNGFRGEIESERDIINRVKYDIFYLENWSLLLDLKIILLTVFNAVKGEKKAY